MAVKIEELTLNRPRSIRHSACRLSDMDYADDIAQFDNRIKEAVLLLHKVESASTSSGLFLNPSKTKHVHINPSANDSVFSSERSQIENVADFKYLGSYTNSQHDIQCRKAQAWAAVHALDKVWKAPICSLTKLKIFRTTVEPIMVAKTERARDVAPRRQEEPQVFKSPNRPSKLGPMSDVCKTRCENCGQDPHANIEECPAGCRT